MLIARANRLIAHATRKRRRLGGVARRRWRRLRLVLKRRRQVIKRLQRVRRADVVVVAHAKSGRTWLAAMISHVYHQTHAIDDRQIIKFDNFHRLDPAIPRLFFTHDSRKSEVPSALAPARVYARSKIVLLVRDPRDVAVSWYFHGIRKRAVLGMEQRRDSLFDFVMATGVPYALAFMRRWLDNLAEIENALLLRYEDLHLRPELELGRLMTFIGQDCPPAILRRAVTFASFESLQSKERARFFASDRLHAGRADDPDTYKVRRGKVGGYRDYFTAEQLAAIDATVEDRVMARFGYRSASAADPMPVTPAVGEVV